MTDGRVAAGYEPVREAFLAELRRDDGYGAAFAAIVDGEPAVDLWGGLARPDDRTAWTSETPVLIFSGTKGLTATCMLMLIASGRLDLDQHVSAYWPAFGEAEKDDIRLRHVLSHQAGLPAVEPAPTPEEARDPTLMANRLAAQAALWPAGESITYHALTFGWLCEGLMRHVEGRSVGQFFREEVARPLGLDAWIGFPKTLLAAAATLNRSADYQVNFGDVTPQEQALLSRVYAGGGIVEGRFVVNDPEFLSAEMPAANGVATARSMARLYGCLANGGELEGVRLLPAKTLHLAWSPIGAGLDRLTHKPLAFSAGYEIQSELQWYGPAAQAFGHSGAGGSVHGAWPHLRTGFSYAMNLMRRDDRDGRAQRILGTLHEVVSTRSRRTVFIG